MPTPEATETLVLDTHVWVWLMQGASELKPALRKRLQAAARNGGLRVSVISVWEVAMLEAKGRLVFAEDCQHWVRRALAAPGLRLEPLSTEVAIASTRLPGRFRGDPADRMLIATARELAGLLVTADRAVLQYARRGHLRVVPA